MSPQSAPKRQKFGLTTQPTIKIFSLVNKLTIVQLGLILVGTYAGLAVVFAWPPVGTIYDGQSLYSCAASLKQIALLKAQYASEENLGEGTPITHSELEQFCGCRIPKCPGGGVYRIGVFGEKPTCSYAGTPGPKPKKKLVWIIWWRWELPPSGPHQL